MLLLLFAVWSLFACVLALGWTRLFANLASYCESRGWLKGYRWLLVESWYALATLGIVVAALSAMLFVGSAVAFVTVAVLNALWQKV